MNLAKIEFKGHAFGEALTSIVPHTDTNIIRVQECDLPTLATLAADVLGECQPYLKAYAVGNLAKWVVRYGAQTYGERLFLRYTARALAVHQSREHYEQQTKNRPRKNRHPGW